MAHHPQLLRLFKENPRCHWCDVVTFLYVRRDREKPPKRSATRDHLVMKKDRKKEERAEVVLACYDCNHKRSIVQAAMLKPDGGEKRIEQLRREWKKGFYWE